jgi:hypothetical protein
MTNYRAAQASDPNIQAMKLRWEAILQDEKR